MRSDERTVKYRRTLWKGRPCHASVLPFVTIRPVKTRAAANHGSQYDAEKNNGGCGRPSEDPRREKRLQYPEFGRCRGHGSFRGRRQREDTKWVLAISRDSINLFFFFPYPFPFVTFHERLVDELYYTIAYVRSHSRIIHTSIRYRTWCWRVNTRLVEKGLATRISPLRYWIETCVWLSGVRIPGRRDRSLEEAIFPANDRKEIGRRSMRDERSRNRGAVGHSTAKKCSLKRTFLRASAFCARCFAGNNQSL